MKKREITISVPKLDLEFKGLQAPEAENWDDIVELCGGKPEAATQAFMAGFIVKAQSAVRSKVESNQGDEEKKIEDESSLFEFAQNLLDEYRYTGARERKPKKKAKISKTMLKEKGASAADIKNIDKLLSLLEGEGVELVD